MGRGAACAGLLRSLQCVGRAGSWPRAAFFVCSLGMAQLLLHQQAVGGDAQAGVGGGTTAGPGLRSAPGPVPAWAPGSRARCASASWPHGPSARAALLTERAQPVLHGLLVAFWPLDEQPFRVSLPGALVLAVGRQHAHAGKARAQGEVRAFSPFDAVPLLGRQLGCDVLDRQGLLVPGMAQAQPGGHVAPAAVRLGRQRCMPGGHTATALVMPTT